MTIITVLTDFGTRDHFAAAMKGVLFDINRDITVVDITHDIAPGDIHTAAFTLAQSCFYYPLVTVHLAVVDPGVGSRRRALVAAAGGHYFVAPDNGLLTYVLQKQEEYAVYEITADHYYRKPVSGTFHGRDIFAPIAAWVSRGIPLPQIGNQVMDTVKLALPKIERIGETMLQGAVLVTDRFGNLITNLSTVAIERPFKLIAAGMEITALHRTYAEGLPGEVFVVPGSSGFLEISMRDRSAAEALQMKSGSPVGLAFL